MTKEAYPALFHFLHKAMKDVTYPATLGEIIKKAGDTPVNVDWQKTQPLKELVGTLKEQTFSCACDFYCKLIASWG